MKSAFLKLLLCYFILVSIKLSFAQKPSDVVIDAIRVVPNTISQGQSHGIIYVDFTNNENSSIEVISPSVNNNRGAILQEFYLGPPAPVIVTKGTSSSLIYSFVAPHSSQGILGDIEINSQFTSRQVNSGKTEVIINGNPGIFSVQTPASPSHLSTTPVSSLGNTNEQFKVIVTNSGQATIILNPATTVLNIGSVLQIHLDATSPNVIAASPSQTELIFQNTYLTGLPYGVFPLGITLYGATNGAAYEKDLSSGSLAYGEDLVDVNKPSRNFLQGATDINVNLQVTNSNIPHTIDADSTTLNFKNHVTGARQSVTNLQRIDDLTNLPLGTSNLQFSFDIPSDFQIGQTDIFSKLSLDNGAIKVQSVDSIDINILSGANISYLEGSAFPTVAIRQQQISVKLTFSNTGTSDLSLSIDSTYIDFPGTTIPRNTINGNYSIGGESSVTLIFNEIIIPVNQPLGNLNINWHIEGIQITGDLFELSGSIINALKVIAASQLEFTSINIIPAQVQQGQSNVRVVYQVSNTGSSDALVDNIQFNFMHNGISTTSNWIRMTAGLFPDTILANQNKIYDVDFIVSSNADTGIVTPSPIVEYRDTLIPQLNRTSNIIISNDPTPVVTPALLRIDSLRFVEDGLAPNAPRVNVNQAFNLELKLKNNGSVSISSAYITFKQATVFQQQIYAQNITSNSSSFIPITVPGLITKGEYVYSAVLDSAFDKYGLKVVNGQPIDNSETVIVEEPRQLSLASAQIISPELALDSSVTVNQVFTIQAQENLVLPTKSRHPNYGF